MYFIFFIKSLFAALVNSVTEFSVKTKRDYAAVLETRNNKALHECSSKLVAAIKNGKIDVEAFDRISKDLTNLTSECNQLFLQSVREASADKCIDIKLDASKKIKEFVLKHGI